MKTQIKEYKNFGKTLFASYGDITVGVTVDIGPRVIYMSYKNGENLFFEDINRETSRNDDPMKDVFGDGAVWYLYGGHRVWMSPEAFPETYLNDNIPVEYEIGDDYVSFMQNDLNGSKVKTSIKLVFENGGISVYNTVKNISNEDIKGAVWALSVMAQGGVGFVKVNDNNTGLLPNRKIVLWPYTKITDKRLHLTDKYIAVKQDKTAGCDFKIACDCNCGQIYYQNKNVLFEKTFENVPDGEYPDWGVNCEFFTGNNFFELESLSTLQTIPQNAEITHKEVWKLYDSVDLHEITEVNLDNLLKITKKM